MRLGRIYFMNALFCHLPTARIWASEEPSVSISVTLPVMKLWSNVMHVRIQIREGYTRLKFFYQFYAFLGTPAWGKNKEGAVELPIECRYMKMTYAFTRLGLGVESFINGLNADFMYYSNCILTGSIIFSMTRNYFVLT